MYGKSEDFCICDSKRRSGSCQCQKHAGVDGTLADGISLDYSGVSYEQGALEFDSSWWVGACRGDQGVDLSQLWVGEWEREVRCGAVRSLPLLPVRCFVMDATPRCLWFNGTRWFLHEINAIGISSVLSLVILKGLMLFCRKVITQSSCFITARMTYNRMDKKDKR